MRSWRTFTCLHKSNLSDAWIVETNFSGAKLTQAILDGVKSSREKHPFVPEHYFTRQNVDLTDADLTGASLRNADLQRINLTGANLTNSSMEHVDLRGAILTGADFHNANMTRSNLIASKL